IQGVTLVQSSVDSFCSFLRTAAKVIADAAPASADVIIVDASRFNVNEALAAIKRSKQENPDASIIAAPGSPGANNSMGAALEPDLGASRIERYLWNETVGRITEGHTDSECAVRFAKNAEQRTKAVVLAPISPLMQPTRVTAEAVSSMGDAVLKQLQVVNKLVQSSKGAVIILPAISWKKHLFQRPHHLARQFARL